METYGGGGYTGIAESTVHYGRAGQSGNLGVSPRPISQWHHGMKTENSLPLRQPYHEVLRSASQQEFDACFDERDAAYHLPDHTFVASPGTTQARGLRGSSGGY